MKNKKPLSVLLAVLLVILVLAGCSGTPASGPSSAAPSMPDSSETSSVPAQSGALTLTDMAGREVALEGPATRIVAINPSDCEILYAIGAGDTLVGRGTYCDYPEAVLDITAVESGENLNIEQVMALEPQVVLMAKMSQSKEQVKALEDAGAKVVVSDAQDIAGVYQAIQLIGAITGKDTEAAELVAGMKQSFADIEAEAGKGGSETIYFEVSPLEYGLWTTGSNTFMDELATLLGLTNAFADIDGWDMVSEEQVIERDPIYIVTTAMYFGEGPTPEEEILGRAGWQDMKAIQSGAVFNADNNQIVRPGPRLVEAAQALYEFVYVTMAQAAAA